MKKKKDTNRFKTSETDTTSYSKSELICLVLAKAGRAMTTQEIAKAVNYTRTSSVRKVLKTKNCLTRTSQGTITHNNLICKTVSTKVQVVRQSETHATLFDSEKPFEFSGEHLRDFNSVLSEQNDVHRYDTLDPTIIHDKIYDDFSKCNCRISITGGTINVWMMKKNKKHGYGLNHDEYIQWRKYVDDKIKSIIGFIPALSTVRIDLQQDDFDQEYDGKYASKVVADIYKLQIYSSFRPEVNKYVKHTEIQLMGIEAVSNIEILQELLSNTSEKILNMENQKKLNYLMLQALKETKSQSTGFMQEIVSSLHEFTMDQTEIVQAQNNGLIDVTQQLQAMQLQTSTTNLILKDLEMYNKEQTRYDQEEIIIGMTKALQATENVLKLISKPSLFNRILSRIRN